MSSYYGPRGPYGTESEVTAAIGLPEWVPGSHVDRNTARLREAVEVLASLIERAGRRAGGRVTMGHIYGYGRVSTLDQNPNLQTDALTAAGCERLFIDKMTAKLASRPQLDRLLELLLPGDTVVVVWKLDRLGRSIKDLIEMVTALGERGVGFRSLTEAIAKNLGVSRPTVYKHLRPAPVAAS